MGEANSVTDLVQRVREGDEEAVAELVRLYEPEIRRIIRFRLRNTNLQRLLDSVDICQSVMANFCLRLAAGQFEIESADQVLKLLVTMARNRLRHHIRRQRTQKRQQGAAATTDSRVLNNVAQPSLGPSKTIAMREMLEMVRSQLPADVRRVADMRGQGHSWDEIALEMNANADAVRKRLTRALDLALDTLGFEDPRHA